MDVRSILHARALGVARFVLALVRLCCWALGGFGVWFLGGPVAVGVVVLVVGACGVLVGLDRVGREGLGAAGGGVAHARELERVSVSRRLKRDHDADPDADADADELGADFELAESVELDAGDRAGVGRVQGSGRDRAGAAGAAGVGGGRRVLGTVTAR